MQIPCDPNWRALGTARNDSLILEDSPGYIRGKMEQIFRFFEGEKLLRMVGGISEIHAYVIEMR